VFTLLALISVCSACSEIRSVTATEEQCLRSEPNTTTCEIRDTTTFSSLSNGQEICFLVTDTQKRPVGALKLTLTAYRLQCIQHWEAITRAYEVKVASAKRCAGAGSCSGSTCAEIKPSSRISELDAYQDKPGNSFCRGTCGFLACGCLSPAFGCLFYRTYIEPIDDDVYKFFSCHAWQYVILATVTREDGQGSQTEKVELVPGRTAHTLGARISPIAISPPPMNLDRLFITGPQFTALVPRDIGLPSMKCASEIGARTLQNCTLELDGCHCRPTDDDRMNCDCREGDWRRATKHKLPLRHAQYSLEAEEGDVYAETAAVPISLQVSLEGLRLTSLIDVTMCSMEIKEPLQGCYGCLTGARIVYTCNTNTHQESLAHVTCGGTQFSTRCGEQIEHEQRLHFQEAAVEELCEVVCPGGKTTFPLKGSLVFVPGTHSRHRRTSSQSESTPGFDFSSFNLDLGHLLRQILQWPQFYLMAVFFIGVILLLVAARILCVCSPAGKALNLLQSDYSQKRR
jgi:hypothetical protein